MARKVGCDSRPRIHQEEPVSQQLDSHLMNLAKIYHRCCSSRIFVVHGTQFHTFCSRGMDEFIFAEIAFAACVAAQNARIAPIVARHFSDGFQIPIGDSRICSILLQKTVKKKVVCTLVGPLGVALFLVKYSSQNVV